jgi:hypothetical protein
MVKDKEKTKVIFRVFEDGEVIAIFPEELGNFCLWTCESYMHVGQHGACEPEEVINKTRLAKPEEYESLKAELENIGYNLDIKKRYSNDSYKVRIEKSGRKGK